MSGDEHDRAEADPVKRSGTASPDEAALLARAAIGDRVAFETLYRCYYPRLTRFLERVTRRPAIVEEVLNDTMLVVWQRADDYNGRSKVSTWVFGIAYRKALKALSRLQDGVADEADVEDMVTPSEPAGEVQRIQLKAVFQDALATLSPSQRAVIELTYYEGHAYRDIAEIMDCPVGTVKTRMFHAHRKLKTLLAEREEDM
jgi:RNA polymerase sigma factor (sigma-70 family)